MGMLGREPQRGQYLKIDVPAALQVARPIPHDYKEPGGQR
jgi:hypothetical protein